MAARTAGRGWLSYQAVMVAQTAPHHGAGAAGGAGLITGGLGGLGLRAALAMVSSSSVDGLLLASRTGRVQNRSERDWAQLVSDSAEGGCRVRVLACDVGL